MESNKYEASRHQRQIVNRFNKFMQEGDETFEKDITSRKQEDSIVKDDTVSTSTFKVDSTSEPLLSNDTEASAETVGKKKQKPKKPPKNVASDLRTRIRSSEYLLSPEITSWKHRLKVRSLFSFVVPRPDDQNCDVMTKTDLILFCDTDQVGAIVFYRGEARSLRQIPNGDSS